MASKHQTFMVSFTTESNGAVEYSDPQEIFELLEAAVYEQSKERGANYKIHVDENRMYREAND